MTDGGWRDYFPSDDLCASRVFMGEITPVSVTSSSFAKPLFENDTVVLAAGVYDVDGIALDLRAPGVYRLQPRGEIGRQFAVLPDTPEGIASIAVEIAALGNADRNKPWPVLSRIASRRRALVHCMQFSNLAVFLADRIGLKARTWLMWDYAAGRRGDALASHAICEIEGRDGTVRLFDPSFGKEFIVESGRTDFATFQSAVLADRPITITPIAHGFGFEYGSRFTAATAEDFEQDAVAACDAYLLDCYGRLTRGPNVLGMNISGVEVATRYSQTVAAASTDPDLTTEARDRVVAAASLGTDPSSMEAAPTDTNHPSPFRVAEGVTGFRVASTKHEPVAAVATDSGTPLLPSALRNDGLVVQRGGVFSAFGSDVMLNEDGLYRFREHPSGRAVQVLIARADPAAVVMGVLDAVATGGRHADLLEGDLMLAARGEKLVGHGARFTDGLAAILSRLGISLRVWSLTAPAPMDHGWPVSNRLTLFEFAAAPGTPWLVDPERGARIDVEGDPVGFATLMTKLEAGEPPSLTPLRATPGRGHGDYDGSTGLSLDILPPLWFDTGGFTASLLRDAVLGPGVLGRQPDGAAVTTRASQLKAREALRGIVSSAEKDRFSEVLAARPVA